MTRQGASVSGSDAHHLLADLRRGAPAWSGKSDALTFEQLRDLGLDDVLNLSELESVTPESLLTTSWQAIVDELAQVARGAQDGSALVVGQVPAEVVVGLLDSELINAASYVLSDDSGLVVVNAAMVVLMYQVSRILASRTRFSDGSLEPTDIETSQAALCTLLDWMRLCAHPHAVPMQLASPHIEVAGAICYAMEQFLLSHEIAHMSLGHHDACVGSRSILAEIRGVDSPTLVSDSGAPAQNLQVEEFLADMFGLMLTLSVRNSYGGQGAYADTAMAVAGARLFFAIQELLEDQLQGQALPAALRIDPNRSHLGAKAREKALKILISNQPNAEEVWGYTAIYSNLLARLVCDIEPGRLRDDRAASWLEDALKQCTAGSIPDYARFLELCFDEALVAQEPCILASMAQVLRSSEQVFARHGTQQLQIDEEQKSLAVEAHQRLKLILNYSGHISQSKRLALNEMYNRAGGVLPWFE